MKALKLIVIDVLLSKTIPAPVLMQILMTTVSDLQEIIMVRLNTVL